jgi:hypothetical protein
MRPTLLWFGVLFTISLVAASAPTHACKPCLEDPLSASMNRSTAVLLGKVALVSEYPKSAQKHGAGEAAIEVRVERWLVKPASGAGKKGRKIPLRLRWDGTCVGKPALPKAGDRAIFFIAGSTAEEQGVLTGYCSAPVVRVEKGQLALPTESLDTWGPGPLTLRKFEGKLKAKKSLPGVGGRH